MDWVESAAFALLLPAGYVHDPAHQLGVANFTCEMVQRGCGDRDSHQFVEDLDRLGVDRSVSVAAAHTSFGGATLADNLFDSFRYTQIWFENPFSRPINSRKADKSVFKSCGRWRMISPEKP